MSRRFGRNQKRRAREALAASQAEVLYLERASVMDRELIREQREDNGRLAMMMQTVGKELGYQAVIAGEPSLLSAGFDGMRLPVISYFDPRVGDITMPVFDEMRAEVIRLLTVKVIKDRMSRALHVQVQLADGAVAYGISEYAIETLSLKTLVEEITPQIASQLILSLRRAT